MSAIVSRKTRTAIAESLGRHGFEATTVRIASNGDVSAIRDGNRLFAGTAAELAAKASLRNVKAAGFAVVQSGYALYGVGKTEKAAWADAKQWVDKDDDGKPSLDGLDCLPATQALIDDVKANGAPRVWGEVDGVLCTDEQEHEHINA